MPEFKSVRALKRNDWIVCPISGLPEQITSLRHYSKERRFFRTTRHDHIRPYDDKIQISVP